MKKDKGSFDPNEPWSKKNYVECNGEAERLLNEIYEQLGDYRDGVIGDTTWHEVCKFFNSDSIEDE